jgi:flagellar hook protein FlgE
MAQYQQAMQMAQQMGLPPPPDPVEVANSMITKDGDFAETFDMFTTADPTMGSDQERIARAEIIAQRAAEVPGYNRYECEKNYLRKIGETNIDTLLPKPNNEPDPMQVLQMEWTKADIEKMKADSASKIAAIEKNNADLMLKMEKQQAELDKILSETMKNLHEIDAGEAQIAMQTLDHARTDVEMELEAQGQLTQRQAYKVMDHPEHGEVTEADIQQTMKDNGMTRDEVIAALQAGSNAPPATA